MSNTVHEIDVDALDALIARLNEAKEYNFTLSKEDIELLLCALATLVTLQSSLSSNDITLHKMRKLLGIVASSEKLTALIGDNAQSDADNQRDENKTRKKPADKNETPACRVEPKVVHHPLVDNKKGDRCPCCQIGTLTKQAPTELLRITGHGPYSAVNHVQARVRCNACGDYFKAPLPEDVVSDGGENQKYGYTARSLMALNKYFMGAPFYRQQSLQTILGMPISASTVFDQCELVANDAQPVFNELLRIAANAVHFRIDDTPHRILDQTEIMKPQRHTQQMQKRTGTYASGLIATLDNGHNIVLFQTNIGYAGEWLDEILAKRDLSLSSPILMSDALSSNLPSQVVVISSLCNTHARRQYVDVISSFREQVSFVLTLYKEIWINEDVTQTQPFSPAQRLAYHHEHSLPIMQRIREQGERQLEEKQVEANSGLGQAIRYMLKHFDRLTRFCTVEGAKLDNNKMESQLKLIVRGRKNFSFYKTQIGAAVADIITSLIATCAGARVNAFEYLTTLQRYRDRVKAEPGNWLPWNYHMNV